MAATVAAVTTRRSAGEIRFWLGWFVALNVLWLALISAFDVAETVLGLGASAVAASAATIVRRQRFVTFRPRARWLLGSWRLPAAAAIDTARVFGVLWRRLARGEPIHGRFRTEPFRLDRDHERRAARRAVYTIGASIPPNAYVVGIDEDEHTVLLHELTPSRRRR
jgi:multisubunit Na+/H+ antiporter MnhE subunit